MSNVRLVYWAGAKAAAGVDSETWSVATISAALEAARGHRQDAGFDRVVGLCALLLDGVTVRGDDLERTLTGDVEVHVLPPFAGGACARSHIR